MTPLLSVESISAGYGLSQALFEVSFCVEEGECVSLLGRNGMGKTTSIRCIAGLVKPSAGSIRLAEKETSAMPSHRIARLGLGLVPEGRHVFPNLTVYENLVATAANRLKRANPWTLERVYGFFPRLKERKGNLGLNLSGGEQQMLAIGRALMTNPRLLILDEATEGLAPLIRKEIWDCLATLKRGGLSILVVDKNLDALSSLCERHYVFEKGSVVWSGTTVELERDRKMVDGYLGV